MLSRTRRKLHRIAGRMYRLWLVPHVPVVGITGSCGKTTTSFLTEAVLGAHGPVLRTNRGNAPRAIWSAVYDVKRTHAYAVQELSGGIPGSLQKALPAVRPRIGVVTNVSFDHYAALRGPDGAAREKVRLVRALPERGHTILNVDDERVLAMADSSEAPVTTFGFADGADIRGSNVSAAWPGRLGLDVTHQGHTTRIETRLLPPYDAHAVLAAVAVGVVTGLPLETIAERIATVDPIHGRMQPVDVDGVTYINDTWKAPLWTVPLALDVLRNATAERKLAVIGTLSDYPGSRSNKYRRVARQAIESADQVLFVGANGRAVERVAEGADGRLSHVKTIREARAWLADTARPGDLVLLKGSATADHMERLLLDAVEPIDCFTETCDLTQFCRACPELRP